MLTALPRFSNYKARRFVFICFYLGGTKTLNNEIIVPIDITQEEKSILAILSLRQFFILFPVAILCGFIFISVNIPFVSGMTEVIVKLVMFLIIGGSASFFAFFKFEKYEQYASQFVLASFKYIRSQKTYSHF
jgi:hypothetical protein